MFLYLYVAIEHTGEQTDLCEGEKIIIKALKGRGEKSKMGGEEE